MTFSEAAMIMMSGGSPAVIQSLTVTQNGRYEAPKGVDGFNPVIVNVPDRYDEGFQAGYTEGNNDGREAQKKICDEEKAILIEEIDKQDEEIETLETYIKTKYPDESDTINAIKGVEFIANVPDAKYSYSYRIASPGKLTNGGLYNSDKYRMYVYVTRSDGEKYTVSAMLPETTTGTDTDPPLYGYNQLGQCAYFTTDGTNAILHYRYCQSGPWTSYDEWRTVYYPLN